MRKWMAVLSAGIIGWVQPWGILETSTPISFSPPVQVDEFDSLLEMSYAASYMDLYKVRSGDTLSGLALKFYGDPDLSTEIAADNQIPDPNKIAAGMKLFIQR